MIEIYTFEEWDAKQDPNSKLEWGNASLEKASQVNQNVSLFKDAPIDIRKMYYVNYVSRLTDPYAEL